MTFSRYQVLCDCAVTSEFCLHDGEPGEGVKCMARDDWYVTLCSLGKCPGPLSKECCQKQSQEPKEPT